MNDRTTSPAELAALHGWELVEDAVATRDGHRAHIHLETGEPGLLLTWHDEDFAARAAWVHARAGSELFVIPDLLRSGPGWIVVEPPPGEPASDHIDVEAGFDGLASARFEVAASLGHALRKLHNLPPPAGCGDVLDDTTGGAQTRWLTFSGWVAHQLERVAESLRTRGYDDDTVKSLLTSISDLRHELSAFHPRTPPGIVHGRIGIADLWLDAAGREVVALTGFGRARLVPREADIAYLLWIEDLGTDEKLARAFYGGYGAARTMDVQRRERFYRRLVAFEALAGMLGDVPRSRDELVTLTGAQLDS